MNFLPTENNGDHPFALIAQHSLLWLVVGNLCGLLLALLLLFPSLGVMLQPLTYGRWVTVHLNASLYGWSSIPLIGLLFQQYLPARHASRLAASALTVWSSVLLFSIIGWLTGHTSGKLFMEWSDASRWAVLFGMVFLAVVLWIALARRLREEKESRFAAGIKILLLLLLSLVPFVMYAAADPALYPPVNPDSGGATGGSLLGSTLVIEAIYLVAPFMLMLERKQSWKAFAPVFVLLAVHFVWFSLLDHGDQSHYQPSEIIALASLLVWVPLLFAHMRRFAWPEGSRPWLIAFAAWGATLALNGVFTFLPHVLDHWKFTNALVAHVHIAMAGMITSFNVLVLMVLNQHTVLRHVFRSRMFFWCWQGGTVVHAGSMLAAGTLEAMFPSWLFTGHPAMNVLYAVRLSAGLVMAAASIAWLVRSHTTKEEPS